MPEQPSRNLAMELVRVTESAALAASRWVGRGDKNGVDKAAVDAMRTVLATVPMSGVIVIGEGEKDEAPMLFNGETVGDGSSPQTDVAVDPIDGTTLTANGRGNALSVIAVSEKGTMFDPGPCMYMQKIAVGPDVKGCIDINASYTDNLKWIARAKSENVRDLTVMILDRPRHDELIKEVRATGARIKLISDGDIFGAIATAWPDAGVDVLFGIGGTPEGVTSAAALKCMGGEIQGKLWPRNEQERIAAAPDVQHQQPATDRSGTHLGWLDDRSGWLNVVTHDGRRIAEEREHGGPTWGERQRSWCFDSTGERIAFVRIAARFSPTHDN